MEFRSNELQGGNSTVGLETGGSLTLPLYPYTVTPELMEAGQRTTLTGSQPRARADPPFDPNAGRPGVTSRQMPQEILV